MTKELLAEEGLSVDDQGFEELMERARDVSRSGTARAAVGADLHVQHEDVLRFAKDAGFQTRFVGYETTEAETVLRSAERANGWVLAKLEESPFYPEGGGQVSDGGIVETPSGRAQGRRRLPARRRPGARARAARRRARRGRERARRPWSATAASPPCATTPPRTCCTRRCAPSSARTCARRARTSGPDKLRFDFTHGERLSPEQLSNVEHVVSAWLSGNHAVRAIETTRDEAEALGAMALFGEKYGDWVRMVEIEDVSRELCGGTHVAGTAEIGLFHVTSETSSASNVRRIEALTGPASAELFEERTRRFAELSTLLRVPEDEVAHAVERLTARVKELGEAAGGREREPAGADELARPRRGRGRRRAWSSRPSANGDPRAARALERLRQKLGDRRRSCSAGPSDGRVHLVANVSPAVVEQRREGRRRDRAAAQSPAVAGAGATPWRRPAAATREAA